MRPEFEELVYFQEIKTQCTSALFAYEQFERRMKEIQEPYTPGGSRIPNSEVFRALHSLLTHSANISRLLFPSNMSNSYAETRGKMLREALGVDKGSPIADRSLRNHLEHYDERLDKWAKRASNSGTAGFATDNIHPKGMSPNIAQESTFRTYLTDTGEFYFLGESYALAPLIAAVREILKAVEKTPGIH